MNCATEWKNLSEEIRNQYCSMAEQKKKQSQDLIYIDNKRTRQTKLANAIEDIRKQVRFLIQMRIAIF